MMKSKFWGKLDNNEISIFIIAFLEMEISEITKLSVLSGEYIILETTKPGNEQILEESFRNGELCSWSANFHKVYGDIKEIV